MKARAWAELGVASVGVLLAAAILSLTGSGARIAGAEFLQAYDLAISKTASNSTVIAGTDLTYEIVVSNTGNTTDHITVYDLLPTGTTFVALTQPPPPDDDFACTTPEVGESGSITCTKTSMEAPETQTIQVTVHVAAGTPKDSVLSNTATVQPTQCFFVDCDSDPSNDTSTANATVDTQADLLLTKIADADAVTAGLPVVYTLTVVNNGPSTAQDVVIVDTIPPNTAFISATPSSGSCVTPPPNGTGMVTCTYPGPTAPGESHSVVIAVLTCTGGVTTCPSPLINSGQATSTTSDPNTANSTATITTAVTSAVPAVSGVGLTLEILLLLAIGAWALARLRAARGSGAD